MLLAFQSGEIKKLLAELQDHVGGLRTVLEASSNTAYAPEGKQLQVSARPAHHRANSADQRKQYFDDFYEALSQSFNCQCGRPHEANLRISDALELVFPEDDAGRAMSSEFHTRTRSATIDSAVTATINTDLEDYDDTR
jgi:hypothetical protein